MNVSNKVLLENFNLNGMPLQNKIVMAPMTRCFALEKGMPTVHMANYYEERASAGLIISEAAGISSCASGYPNTPGIYSNDQIDGWKRVAEKVHNKGARFFIQLWHAGMMSHPFYREGELPISASSTKPKRETLPRTEGRLAYGYARAMNREDMEDVVEKFCQAAINAIEAGCDGVEIHAANGYLLDSFLHYDTNQRSDAYGGNPENMCRFILEVVDAIIDKIGAYRLGVRLSPVPVPSMENMEEDIRDEQVFSYLLAEMEKREISYIHVSSDNDLKDIGQLGMSVSAFIRKNFKGILIGCGSYDLELGSKAIEENKFDLLAFGRMFIANPHLVEMIASSSQPQLKEFDPKMLLTL